MPRRYLATLLIALASALFLGASPAQAFGFEDVAELARRDAARPYQTPEDRLPPALSSLDYDALRDIRYRPARAIWRQEGLPFELQFFHLGGGHRVAVAMHEVHQGQVRPLTYDSTAWDFGRQTLDAGALGGLDGLDGLDLGLAGLRVHHALNHPNYKDELIVFLGASYFRALGRGQQYGLSARGLAIDTVGAPAGAAEEFPRFKAFWIERPALDATTLTIHALLDSPRATGAYRFVVRPGEATTLDVRAKLFLRSGTAPVATLGIAPLTSMFLHGENQPRAADFRPEVHDSDGLLVAASAVTGTPTEWLWRPLFNPAQPQASSFAVQRLQGYGLLQRDRRFAAFEDTEARYERRPSVWVEPLGDWGPGRVELLLLPTPDETHDNVAAYWVPATLPAPGQSLDLAWRLHWQGDAPTAPPHGQTLQSRRGAGWMTAARAAQAAMNNDELQWHVDFDGPALRALPATAPVQAVVTAPAGARVLEARAYPHPLGGWRMHLRVQRLDLRQPLELRAYLAHSGSALTETWAPLIPQELP